jgi:hypothetical protein
MRTVGKAHGITPPREAIRQKDMAICWICENWNFAEEHLSTETHADQDRQSREREFIAGNWEQICKIESFLVDENGQKASMRSMLAVAKTLSTQCKVRLERDCRRNKRFLKAWFARNWNEIEWAMPAHFAHQTSEINEAPIEPTVFDPFEDMSFSNAWIESMEVPEPHNVSTEFSFLSDDERFFGLQ